MIKYYLSAILVSFLSLYASTSCAQTSPLSVEKIMKDPKWMGTFPENIEWGTQSNTIYFDYNPEGNSTDSLYKVTLKNLDKIEKVTLAERKAMISKYGSFNNTKTKKSLRCI